MKFHGGGMKIESYEHVHESMDDFSPLVFGKVKVKAYELILVVSYANGQLLFSGFLLVFIFTPYPIPSKKKRKKSTHTICSVFVDDVLSGVVLVSCYYKKCFCFVFFSL